MVERTSPAAGYSGPNTPYIGELPDLVANEDADAIWDRLRHLVGGIAPGSPEQVEQLTQTVFLCLVSMSQFREYALDAGADEEIVERVLALNSERVDRFDQHRGEWGSRSSLIPDGVLAPKGGN